MTQGAIWKKILLFSLPLLLGNVFQQLYNTVDSVIVGNYVGGDALAAVGTSGPIINLLVGLFMGIATGAGVVIARYFGAQDSEGVHDAVHTTLAATFIGGLFLTVVGVLLSPTVVRLIGVPENIMADSISYLRIYFGGIIAMMTYNMGAGILRAVGDSKTPLYFLIISSIVNIILDMVFVIVLDMGVAGVAWATLIAQAVSATLTIMMLCRVNASYRVSLRQIRIKMSYLKEIIRIGLPSGLQNAIISMSNIVVQSYINSFGSAAIAGYSTYGKVDAFALMPVMSLSMAITTFTSQNIGAQRYDRVRQGVKTGLCMTCGTAVVLTSLVVVFARALLGIFTSDQQIIDYGLLTMTYQAPFYIILAVNNTLAGILRGAGKASVPSIIMAANMCGVRILWLSILMPIFNSIIVVYLAFSVTWLTTGLCLIWYYRHSHWLEQLEFV
ncbi:MAG: MATE family efflux transporter [Ruminococcaceae bacterium]|nr:MATE family efflux transporter [Oscillospiraceae bacterium]